jgi:hypothetical protein
MPGGIPRPAIGGGAFGQRPGMPGQPGISGPQQGGSPVETRRRIRIINSKP